MITLYSYPTLFGVADNNGYGLKVFAFLRLVGLPFVHKHIFDASAAPRGQLPYVVDNGETIGDSETIIARLIGKYELTIDAALGSYERNLSLLVTRLLDDLYWVMSYSRWKDERYWPVFRAALMREHVSLSDLVQHPTSSKFSDVDIDGDQIDVVRTKDTTMSAFGSDPKLMEQTKLDLMRAFAPDYSAFAT